MKLAGRALHFVFKVADRAATASFYRDVLGMKVLRHEEFSEGCEAQCNGQYANRWSKTMIGYGPENDHFVVELTYNYPVKSYKRGNDFLGVVIQSSEVIKRVKEQNIPIEQKENNILIRAPGGYPFIIIDKPQPTDQDPVKKVILASSNLLKSIDYWHKLLGLEIVEQTSNSVTLAFDSKQTSLELQETESPVDHAEAYGRIAFSIPTNQLAELQEKVDAATQKILTRLISLDTPGKATVSVVILADPDGHEICFVGDEGFRELSQVDPIAEKALDKFISKEQKSE